MSVLPNKRYKLGIPEEVPESRWIRFEAHFSELRPVGWCDQNFASTAGEKVTLLDHNDKETGTTATVFSELLDAKKAFDRILRYLFYRLPKANCERLFFFA